MTFINRNQIILLLSFISLIGISYFLSISFGENLAREKKVSKKVTTDEDPIHIEEKLEIDFTLVQKYYLQEGETFTGALKQADLQDDEINDVVNIISKKIDLRKLKVGTLIETYTKSVNDKKIIYRVLEILVNLRSQYFKKPSSYIFKRSLTLSLCSLGNKDLKAPQNTPTI